MFNLLTTKKCAKTLKAIVKTNFLLVEVFFSHMRFVLCKFLHLSLKSRPNWLAWLPASVVRQSQQLSGLVPNPLNSQSILTRPIQFLAESHHAHIKI
jgi:hypothetical protein